MQAQTDLYGFAFLESVGFWQRNSSLKRLKDEKYLNFLGNTKKIAVSSFPILEGMKDIPKKLIKKRGSYQKKDSIVPVLATKYGVTPRFVRMVRDGESSNEAIFSDYMFMKEGMNKLIEAVKKAVPF